LIDGQPLGLFGSFGENADEEHCQAKGSQSNVLWPDRPVKNGFSETEVSVLGGLEGEAVDRIDCEPAQKTDNFDQFVVFQLQVAVPACQLCNSGRLVGLRLCICGLSIGKLSDLIVKISDLLPQVMGQVATHQSLLLKGVFALF
jgi:hypothetical protein